MSIKSTQHVSREAAIARIAHITALALNKNYIAIEQCSFEHDHEVSEFVNEFIVSPNFDVIHNWTNKMIEEILDTPFYRFSMFENYFIDVE